MRRSQVQVPSPAPRRSKVRFAPFFYAEKHPPASLLLLFRKKARSAHLFACKRAYNGSLSLPPFCELWYSRRKYCCSLGFMRRHIGCRSSIAKGHVHVGYSVASALITPLVHYQPFASAPFGANTFYKPEYRLLLLYRKKV